MQIAKIKAYIGFAIKSRSIVYGVDNIENKSPYLIVYTSALATSENRLLVVAQRKGSDIIKLDEEKYRSIIDNEKIKAFAILDKNLAKAIKEHIAEEMNW